MYLDVSERVEALKCKLKDTWSPHATMMYKDPTLNDQTAWFTLDKTQLLKDEIQTVRDLLELEPDSACKRLLFFLLLKIKHDCECIFLYISIGSLQTLVHFLNQLILRVPQDVDVESIQAEMMSILDKLVEIDSDREFRYRDKSKGKCIT